MVVLLIGAVVYLMQSGLLNTTGGNGEDAEYEDYTEGTEEPDPITPEFTDADILAFKELEMVDDTSTGDPQKIVTYEITNTGNEEIWYLDAEIQFLDKNGNQLYEDGRYFQGKLEPGKHYNMYSFSYDVDVDKIQSAKVKSYSYKIGSLQTNVNLQTNSVEVYEEDKEWYNNVDFDEVNVFGFDISDKGLDDFDSYETDVTVTNNGLNSVEEVSFEMEYFDKDGNPIENDGRFSDSVLDPKKSVIISSYCSDYKFTDPKQVASYAIVEYQYKLRRKDSRGFNQYTLNLVNKTAYGEYYDY